MSTMFVSFGPSEHEDVDRSNELRDAIRRQHRSNRSVPSNLSLKAERAEMIQNRIYFRTIGQLVAITLVMIGIVALRSVPEARAADIDCTADVQVIGVAGSGENPQQKDGEVGQTVWSGISYFKTLQEAQGRKVDWHAINYPALGVPALFNPFTVSDYVAGIQQGVDKTIEFLNEIRTIGKCDHQRIVMMGYSQGAMVLHRVAHILEDPGYSDLMGRIDGIVLIADGDKVVNDRVQHYGTASNSAHGVGIDYNFISKSGLSKFDSRWGTRIKSVCNAWDPVCGLNYLPAPITGLFTKNVHGTYKDSWSLRVAITNISMRYPRVKLLSISPTGLTAFTGISFSRQLTATTTGNACAIRWSTEGMPTGATLSPTGLLSGKVGIAGQWNLTLVLKATCPKRPPASFMATFELVVAQSNATTTTTTTTPTPAGSRFDNTYRTTNQLIVGPSPDGQMEDITASWRTRALEKFRYENGADEATAALGEALTAGRVAVSQHFATSEDGVQRASVAVCWSQDSSLRLSWFEWFDYARDGAIIPRSEVSVDSVPCIEMHWGWTDRSPGSTASVLSTDPLLGTAANYFVQTDNPSYPAEYAGLSVRTQDPNPSVARVAAAQSTAVAETTTTEETPAAQITPATVTTTTPPPPDVTTTPPAVTSTRETSPTAITTTPSA